MLEGPGRCWKDARNSYWKGFSTILTGAGKDGGEELERMLMDFGKCWNDSAGNTDNGALEMVKGFGNVMKDILER